MREVLQSALALAEMGVPVLPVTLGEDGVKRPHPLLGFGWTMDDIGSTDPLVIQSWFVEAPDAGLGIVNGHRSRIVIIDLDPRHGGDRSWEAWLADCEAENHGLILPAGLPVVRTGGGGTHIWLRLPAGVDVRRQIGFIEGVDILGSGGWAVVPPSILGGRRWEWVDSGSLIEVPWLLERLKPRRANGSGGFERGPSRFANESGAVDLARGLDGYVPPGEQHDYLISTAASLRARGTPDAVALVHLRAVVRRFENDPDRRAWTDTDADEAWAYAVDNWPDGPGELPPEYRAFRPAPIGLPPGFVDVTDPAVGAARPITGEMPAGAIEAGGDPDAEHRAREAAAVNAVLDAAFVGGPIAGNAPDEVIRGQFHSMFGDSLMWMAGDARNRFGLWYQWNGRIWQLDTAKQVRLCLDMVRDALVLRSGTAPEAEREVLQGAATRLRQANAHDKYLMDAQHLFARHRPDEHGISRSIELDTVNQYLTCPNGRVDLRGEPGTGAIGFSPEDYATFLTGAEFDPSARSALLDDYFETFLPEDDRREALLLLLGAALLGHNQSRLLVWIKGPSTTGKSQLTDALQLTLGGHFEVATTSVFVGHENERARSDITSLRGKRIITTPELTTGIELHADRLKALTGESTEKVRTLYKEYSSQKLTFTPFFFTNEIPTVRGVDEALARRCVAVFFEHQITRDQERPEMKELFIGDRDVKKALLALMVDRARRVSAAGSVLGLLPASAFAAGRACVGQMDDVAEWFSSALETSLVWEQQTIRDSPKTSQLYQLYRSWVLTEGTTRQKSALMGKQRFGKRLLEVLVEELASGRLRHVHGQGGSHWVGLRLRSLGEWDENRS